MIRSAVLSVLLAVPAAAQLAEPWHDLGFALAGAHGAPQLVAAGSLSGGSALVIDLAQGQEFAHAYLVVGLSTLYAPYKGGTLVPAVDLLVPMATDAAGALHVEAHWPHGVPAGVPLVLQFWINDPLAPVGRSGSNAVGALTP